MFKNIIKYFLLFLLVFILAGCETTHVHNYVNGKCTCGVTDPNYDPFEDNYEYVTPKTDELKLTADWEGKDFIKDGIGEVQISQFVDGDTAHFKTKNGEKITVRFTLPLHSHRQRSRNFPRPATGGNGSERGSIPAARQNCYLLP